MEPPPEAAEEAPPPPPPASKDPQFRVPELRQPTGKSNPNNFCKTLIVVALLLVVPLFPSRAPEFVGQGNFNEFWEIFHLLFFGIAVSYGLFCCRVVDRERIGNDDSDGYVSGISQFSSFFDGGFDDMCGVDEHDYCQCLMKSGDLVLEQHKCVIDGNAVSNVCYGNGENVSRAWLNQYMKGESLIVLSNGKYYVGGDTDYKPLNLPVRSLRSGIVENEKVEMKGRYDLSMEGESMSNDNVKVVKIRGVVPVNLEKKFDEVAGASSIPWRSKSGRMVSREERNDERPNAHCRPHSVGEIEFEHIKSGSFLGPKFSSSPELVSPRVELVESKKVLPVSRSKVAPLNGDGGFGVGKMHRLPTTSNCGEEKLGSLNGNALSGCGRMRPPVTGNRGEEKVAPQNGEVSFGSGKMRLPTTVDRGEEKVTPLNGSASFRGGNMRLPTTVDRGEEKVTPLNGDASFRGGNMRPPTTGNRGEEKVAPLNGDASFGGEKTWLPITGEEDELGKGRLAVEPLESDTSSPSLVNVLSKAKSVRTIKPRRYNAHDKEQRQRLVDIDRKPRMIFRKYESDSMVKRRSEEEPENHSVNHRNHEFDSVLSMPNSKPSLEFCGEGKEGIDYHSVSESEQELGNEENAKTYLDIDSELEGSEVDRKAGEFIAKFREQIRLQKASSTKG